ncbi:ImmA/IrrE family metallo-endopeptidase [Paraburkholderia madseniana]|nr:ImmA/IrrE family metallo-endopeptidase [Paraburkholderia madseniana]
MPANSPMQSLYSRLSQQGLKKSFVKSLLPDWWEDEIARDPSGLLQAQLILARSLNFDLASLRDTAATVRFQSAHRKFKHSKAVDKDSIRLSAEYATGMAKLAVQAMSTEYVSPPSDPTQLRANILKGRPQVDLDALLDFCFASGIPVLHIGSLPGKKMDAVAVKQNGRAAIVLSRNAAPAYLLFHLAHEIGHIALGHLGDADGTLIDAELKAAGGGDADEREADSFAIYLLNGSNVKYTSNSRYLDAQALAYGAARLGAEKRIDPGHIVLNYGFAANNFPLANRALSFLKNCGGPGAVNAKLTSNLDWDELSDDQASLLTRAVATKT